MLLSSIRRLTPLAFLSLFFLTSCGDPDAGAVADDATPDTGRDDRPAEADCGDGELQEGEECDDSNRTNGDGCSRDCLREPAELCAPCASDDDCGRDIDWCIRVDGERVCARDCSQEACPTGYVCSPVTREDGRVAGQCLPERGICGGCADADTDGICDETDVCPGADDTLDADSDDIPDGCDVCPTGDDRIDTDNDGTADACDTCPDDPGRALPTDGPCDGIVCSNDADGDGVCDDTDRCAGGDDRIDSDSDGIPNACDDCPTDRNDDSDGDGSCDSADLCPTGDDTLDTDLDGTPDACDACPDSALGDLDDDGVCDDEDLCPLGDDTLDTDRDGVPDACEPSPGSYVYDRVPIGGLGNQAAVAFHPSNTWALLLQRTELVRVIQTADLTTESWDPPGSGSIYWQDLAFNPEGTVAILVGYRIASGSSSTTGVVYRFDTEVWATAGLASAITALTPTAADRYMAVEFDANSGTFILLSANGTGTTSYNVALRSYDPQANTFGFIAAQATGAGCSDFAFVANEFGDPGTLIVCGENGYDALYWTEVGGISEWRLDLGNNSLGNTSRVAAHPEGNYALMMSWSGDAIYRFQGGIVNSYGAAPRFSTRRIWGAEFAPDGRRALIYGQYMSITGGAFFVVLEYRHDEYSCTSPLTPSCDITEVSIRGADVAPWIAPSGARINDASWRSDCDGGLLVGGNSSFSGEYGLVATFELEGGRPCW